MVPASRLPKRAAAHQALYTMGWIRGAVLWTDPMSQIACLLLHPIGATSTFQPGHGYVQSPNVLANVAADKGLRLDWYIYKVGPDHLISWRAQCTSKITSTLTLWRFSR